MNKVEIQKELLKSKVNAYFSHYASGKLYYNVQLEMGVCQFPLPVNQQKVDVISIANTYDEVYEFTLNGVKKKSASSIEIKGLELSSALGNSSFGKEMRASELNRWIGKAVEQDEFVLILPNYPNFTAEVKILTKESGKTDIYVDGNLHSSQG